MREVRLWNSLTKTKQTLAPLAPPEVSIYSCGPTVYARQHLGNLRAYVFADLLGRSLRALGYATRHVINITDVGHLTDDADAGDDKMEKAAREDGRSAREIADHWTKLFLGDLERIGVQAPDIWSRATDHIPEQIAMVQALEAKGFTYRTGDGIYFDTAKDPNYPAFGGGADDALRAQERIAGSDAKRNSRDFALWKFSGDTPRQMEWPSPWGTGFPGWHIECSAMSTKHLGARFDIHTGGVDHLAVHHPNEIAQSEAALGVRPWVQCWMHGGWLMLDGAKISKSVGRPPNLDDLVESGIDPRAFRLFLLGGHYRQEMNLTREGLLAADQRLRRLRDRFAEAPPRDRGDAEAEILRGRFHDALADDLGTPRALAILEEATKLAPNARGALMREIDSVLGLDLAATPASADPRWQKLAEERESARARRDFVAADAIRHELRRAGWEVEDTEEGPRLRAVGDACEPTPSSR